MAYTAVLSQVEVDALLAGFDDDSAAAVAAAPASPDRALTPYDLASQAGILRGRMRTLDLINERFARHFREGLLAYIRRSPDITNVSLEAQTYGDFIRNLPVPANINMVQMRPLRGTALFVFDPRLVNLVIDYLFGSDGRFHMRIEGRAFTRTEQRIIKRLLDITVGCYGEAWKSVRPLEFQYVRSEELGKLANITSETEMVLTTTLNVDIGPTGGFLLVCLPYSMLEPIRDLLSNPIPKDEMQGDTRWGRQMTRELRAADVQLSVDFATVQSTVGELVRLQQGQILPIDLPQTVTAAVDGTPVMECRVGHSPNGHYALRVERVFDHALEEQYDE